MNYEVLDLGLVVYKDVIVDPAQLIEQIETLNERFLANEHGDNKTFVKDWQPWEYGETVFNMQKFFPRAQDLDINDFYYDELKTIASSLYGSLNDAYVHYSTKLYPFAEKNIKSREPSIHLLKYGPGGHLPQHQDQGVSTRVLSSVIYLNDDYEGGEIEFIHSGVKIKPEAGSIIFFPSNFLYVHEVYPITSGFRYSMPHWYHNVKNLTPSNGDE